MTGKPVRVKGKGRGRPYLFRWRYGAKMNNYPPRVASGHKRK